MSTTRSDLFSSPAPPHEIHTEKRGRENKKKKMVMMMMMMMMMMMIMMMDDDDDDDNDDDDDDDDDEGRVCTTLVPQKQSVSLQIQESESLQGISNQRKQKNLILICIINGVLFGGWERSFGNRDGFSSEHTLKLFIAEISTSKKTRTTALNPNLINYTMTTQQNHITANIRVIFDFYN